MFKHIVRIDFREYVQNHRISSKSRLNTQIFDIFKIEDICWITDSHLLMYPKTDENNLFKAISANRRRIPSFQLFVAVNSDGTSDLAAEKAEIIKKQHAILQFTSKK